MGAHAFTLRELSERLGGEVLGDASARVSRIGTLEGAQPGDISFCHRADYAGALSATRATAVIVGPAFAGSTDKPRIVADDPYLYFARVATLLQPADITRPGIHPSAAVDPSARVDASAAVGPLATIGARAIVGPGAVIEAGCVVSADCRVGAESRLFPRAVMYAACTVGSRCIIHAGAVLGSDGFGFAPDGERWQKIPQTGSLVLGDDVEVGANTTIDRGALDDTTVEDGVKIDNLVQIGHNCRIGAHTAIAGCVGIAGSTRIGRRCVIGGAANIAGHLEIVDGTVIAGGTSITRSIRQPGTYVGVFPFSARDRWLRNTAHLRRLDELAQRLSDLEKATRGKASHD